MPQTPLEKVVFGHLNSHSHLLLYGQTPTSNLIESPAKSQEEINKNDGSRDYCGPSIAAYLLPLPLPFSCSVGDMAA